MLYDTISLGSATLDLFLKSDQFLVRKDTEVPQLSLPYGAKIDVTESAMQSGGGATNTAVGFARAGLRAAVIAEMGKDLAADSIIAELKKEGVDTSLMVQEEDEHTGVSALLVSSEGGRSAITARGAATMLTLKDIPFAKIKANWVHISSLGNNEVLTAVAKHCHQNRIRFSWNPGGAELTSIEKGELHLHEIFPTLFCLNKEEAQRIVAAGYDLENAGEIIIETDGRSGGRYYEKKRWTSYQPRPSKAVQETGAGDAFLTGVVIAYLHDRLTSEAIEWGKKNAASVVQNMGAKTGLLRASDFGI